MQYRHVKIKALLEVEIELSIPIQPNRPPQSLKDLADTTFALVEFPAVSYMASNTSWDVVELDISDVGNSNRYSSNSDDSEIRIQHVEKMLGSKLNDYQKCKISYYSEWEALRQTLMAVTSEFDDWEWDVEEGDLLRLNLHHGGSVIRTPLSTYQRRLAKILETQHKPLSYSIQITSY